jgi:hypothetical protein
LTISHSSIALSDVSEAKILLLCRPFSAYTVVQAPGLKTFGTDPREIMAVSFGMDLSVGVRQSLWNKLSMKVTVNSYCFFGSGWPKNVAIHIATTPGRFGKLNVTFALPTSL